MTHRERIKILKELKKNGQFQLQMKNSNRLKSR